MPAHLWEIEYAERKGIAIHPALKPEVFVGNGNKRIARIDFSRIPDSVMFKARLVDEMHPEVVGGPHAWWMPEKPRPEYGCFQSNINALLSLDPPYDPVMGVPQMRAILCRVKKADAP